MKGKSQAGRFFKIQMDMKDKCPLNLHLMSPSHLSKLLVTTVFFTGDLVCLVWDLFLVCSPLVPAGLGLGLCLMSLHSSLPFEPSVAFSTKVGVSCMTKNTKIATSFHLTDCLTNWLWIISERQSRLLYLLDATTTTTMQCLVKLLLWTWVTN